MTEREREPIDPDTAVAPWPATSHLSPSQAQAVLLGTIAAGGMIGAAARYGASLVWPTADGAFPWTTFWVNVVGCALMGLLMVLITERYDAHPLVRPFVGTGVLGGFTTFSTATVDTQGLIGPHTSGTALPYAAATLLASLLAIWAGVTFFLAAIAPMGCRFGMEQFGSGLDSFQLLTHLKPAFFKIDPGLTDEMGKPGEAQDKVREITARARDEGIATLAEDVDDAQAMSQLFSAGVDYVAGGFVAPVGAAMNFDFS